MPSFIALEKIANQQLSINLEGSRFEISVTSSPELCCATITRDDVVIVSGQRIIAKSFIIPYQYLEGGKGNFMFVPSGDSDNIPYYTDFGDTFVFAHFSDAEMEAIRAIS